MLELMVIFATILTLLTTGIAAHHSESRKVSLAAAYNSDTAINDAWARYIVWQHPNGTIMLQARDEKPGTPGLIQIEQSVSPKKNSPLAAIYRQRDSGTGGREIVISYLDDKQAIVVVRCTHREGEFFDWTTTSAGPKSSSGLALARTNGTIRRFFLDEEDFVVQEIDGEVSRLGPKAIQKSQVAATVPIGTTDIHVFFLSADGALSSITYKGNEWVEEVPAIDGFASKPDINFAVGAWSNPSILRVFYINEHKIPSEWTFGNGSWANTTRSLAQPPVSAVEAGSPVAVSRSADGTGRYLEYFYAIDGGHINYLAKTFANGGPFQLGFASFETEKGEKLSRSDKITIIASVVSAAIAVVGIYVAYRYRTKRSKKKAAPSSPRPSVPDGEQESNPQASTIVAHGKPEPVCQVNPVSS